MARLALAAALMLTACAKHVELREISVDEAAAAFKSGATPVDANNPAFREHNGTVPGAVLLTNYRTYELKELGEDRARQLVFYCTNRL
jgi:hypothetical protein